MPIHTDIRAYRAALGDEPADEPDLHPEGSFKAAEARYTAVDQIVITDLTRWLEKSVTIQWDYKNIVKRKGKLERLK